MKLYVLILIGFITALSSCNIEKTDTSFLVVSTHNQMGTSWQIKLYSEDTSHARVIIDESWSILDSLNMLMSNFEAESEISILSTRSGDSTWLDLSNYTIDILEKSRDIWEASDGAFDITIAPVMRLWRRSFKTQKEPSQQEIEVANMLVGMEYLQKRNHQARLLRQGMSIDLGGIAKGYAVDVLYDYISSNGYDRVLVEGGGDLRVGEAPPDKKGWIIESEVWSDSTGFIDQLDTVSRVAIATSGNQFQYLVRGSDRLQHHINPTSGEAINNVYRVEVRTDFCWKADAISTAISILRSDKLDITGYSGSIITGNNPYELTYFDH